MLLSSFIVVTSVLEMHFITYILVLAFNVDSFHSLFILQNLLVVCSSHVISLMLYVHLYIIPIYTILLSILTYMVGDYHYLYNWYLGCHLLRLLYISYYSGSYLYTYLYCLYSSVIVIIYTTYISSSHFPVVIISYVITNHTYMQ